MRQDALKWVAEFELCVGKSTQWTPSDQRQLEELLKDSIRYEKLRKLTPQEFQGLYEANIAGAGRFDNLVDTLEITRESHETMSRVRE